MVYTKHTWVDGAAGNTPLSAARLNEMEAGIGAGRYEGDWAAGTYPAGALVAYQGYLWVARRDTSAEPLMASIPTSSDLTNTTVWTPYSIVSATSPEVVLINNAGSDNASVASVATYPTNAPLKVQMEGYASGQADVLAVGVISTGETLSDAQSGIDGLASFRGVKIDLFNAKRVVVDGTYTGNYMASGLSQATYRTLTVDLSGGQMVVSDSYGTWSMSTSVTFSYSTMRVVVGARTGGSVGVFKARNPTVTTFALPPDWRRLAALVDLT